MNFVNPLRRASKLPALQPSTPVADYEGQHQASDFQTSHLQSRDCGLVSHYANRYVNCSLPTKKPTPQSIHPDVRTIGRGSPEHTSYLAAINQTETPVETATPDSSKRLRRRQRAVTLRQRLIAAGLVATVLLSGFGGSVSAQNRYQVRAGDTLESVAAEFGADPEAILRSSWLSNPPYLTVGDVIIIPVQGQSPDEAAAMAAERVGTSPWTSGVYWVEEGDSIELISGYLGVDPEALLELNGLTWSDLIYAGERLLIPGGATDVSVPTEPASDYSAYVWVPTHQQEHSLSCEYASAFIATSAFGNPIPESVFINSIPVTPNPHFGFRGDIDGTWGNYDDYGIYPEPMVPILNDYGFAAEVFYSLGDTSELKAHLDAGHPVVTWLAMWGDTGLVYKDDGTYTVFAGSHVMTAYAYNDEGVFLSNPGNSTYLFMEWATFVWMWGTIDGMSMAVYPY